MQALADDLRHAIRRLRLQRWAAIIAGGMLALAIGLTSAMLTIVDHMLLRPVPFRDPVRQDVKRLLRGLRAFVPSCLRVSAQRNPCPRAA